MAIIDPKVIGAQIRMRKPNLTHLELKVVDHIIAKEDFSEDTSIKDIAAETEVSEAMIVKIAKKLGFQGYRDFRASLVQYRRLEVAQMFNEISPDDNMQQLMNKVFRNSIQALEETLAILQPEVLSRSVDILCNAKEISLYGVGGSAEIAGDLMHKFLRIGLRSQVFSDSHMMLMSASLCNDQSAVVAISHSGRTSDVIEPLALARKNGAKTIVLTNYATSPISKYADVVLSSTSQGSAFLGENASARVAMLNILDVIFVALAQKNLKVSEENLIKTRSAVQNKRVLK